MSVGSGHGQRAVSERDGGRHRSVERDAASARGEGIAYRIGGRRQFDFEALRLCGLPDDAPARCLGLPAGTCTLALATCWDLPNLAAGATANVDVTVPRPWRGAVADASLDTSNIALVLNYHV
ncbi:hypothetical protein [Falsiroseomonas sp.]|uniref:hypothetical protein n=1 Tax=Falsiroseomonas sp. TaxID=2870721 RepID=UPI003569AC30